MIGAYYLGIDVGSVSTNLVVTDEEDNVIEKFYIKTGGKPINALVTGMGIISERLGSGISIEGVGTTGSGRKLARHIIGADSVKNEITAHAIAAQKVVPEVRTILEIGGQDSKIIFMNNGVVVDFAMNTVCAAGTGSFLDRQAARLEIPIEEFGKFALLSKNPVRIAGRCAVFAESDMIHKQQTGQRTEDIIRGLCEALVRNYLNNLAKGKTIKPPIVFQGGVAANIGITAEFERELGARIIIPENFDVMGAYGASILAKYAIRESKQKTRFLGFNHATAGFTAKSIDCGDCSNMCEVIEIISKNQIVARWGDKCGKWSSMPCKLVK